MERVARRLAVFSLGAMVAAIAIGALRSFAPVQALLDGPEAHRYSGLFHSHFDQLCWLGTAALAAMLWILRDYYTGSAWPPVLALWTYPIGSLLFSTAFLAKAIGLAVGNAAAATLAFAVLSALGGLLLLAALMAVLLVAWGIRPSSKREREQF